jgi:adenylate cyclase
VAIANAFIVRFLAHGAEHKSCPLQSAAVFDPRLTALLDARARSADRAAIDDEIWRAFGEEWCVMATDLSGFSRGVAEQGIIPFLQTIHESSRILIPVVERHGGRLLKMEGDSFLAIFADANDGVRAAIEMQRAVRRSNDSGRDPVLLGVGLGFGRVLRVADAEVYGGEVNSACILGETHARGYDILVTQAVRDAVRGIEFEEFPYVPPGARGAYRVLYSSSSEGLNIG